MKKKLKQFFTFKVILGILTTICVVLIGVTLFTDKITGPIRDAASAVIIPLQKGINGIGLWFTEKGDLFNTKEELEAENKELTEKVNSLSEENVKLSAQLAELTEMRKLLNLDEKYSEYKKTAANVIGKSSDNWYSTFTIDKGLKDGLSVDMNVLADGGLVGIISECHNNYSIVRSIIDDKSSVSAMLLKSSDDCTVSGDLKLMDKGYISFSHLSKDVDVKEGDMLVTSNISSKFQSGLLIGYACDIEVDANNLSKSGHVVPVVDFNHIQKVLVILDKKESLTKSDDDK